MMKVSRELKTAAVSAGIGRRVDAARRVIRHVDERMLLQVLSELPSQLEVALQVGRALDAAGCAWMIGGSIATSAYGEPRATNDVDLAANLRPSACRTFVEGLGDDFYAGLDAVRDAARCCAPTGDR